MHVPWETPTLIDVALAGVPTVRRTIVDESAPALPHVTELGGLVVMGGPQDANDDTNHPGLSAERRLLAEAVDADVPVLGVCLGMQLLGLALGARLHLRHGTEIGFAPIELTTAGARDPVLSPLTPEEGGAPVVLHWHTDAVELPAGATLLAASSATPVQAFRAGSALGTQFHPEADDSLLASWLALPRMISGLSSDHVARIDRDGATHLPGLRPRALAGLGTFAAAVRDRRL
jgi:GMP synthase (glutamine-hydrolysing)